MFKNTKQQFRRKNYDDRPKLLAHKGTDTGEDFQNAMKEWDYPQKLSQLRQVMYESEENIKELTKYINENQKIENKEYSKLEGPLAELIKSLKQRQFDTAQFFAKSNFEHDPLPTEDCMDEIREILDTQFNDIQRATAEKVFEYLLAMFSAKHGNQREILNQSNPGVKMHSLKQKKGKGGGGGDTSSKSNVDELNKRVRESEKNLQEAHNNLENRENEILNLQMQIANKDMQLSKQKADLDSEKNNFIVLDIKTKDMKIENLNMKQQLTDMKSQNKTIEKKIKEVEQNLKDEKFRIQVFETENKKLKSQLDIIKNQTADMSPQEQAQILKLCEMIMESTLNEDDKQKCLQQISDFYKNRQLTDQDKNEFNKSMLSHIQGASSSQGSERLRGGPSGYTSGKDEVLLTGKSSTNRSKKGMGKNLGDKNLKVEEQIQNAKYQEVEYVETLADGTQVVRTQKVFQEKMDVGAVVRDADGNPVKVKGYEKKKVIQKVKQKVTKKRIVKNENGEEVEEEYETEEEVEKEVEIEVPIFEKVDIKSKRKKSTLIIPKSGAGRSRSNSKKKGSNISTNSSQSNRPPRSQKGGKKGSTSNSPQGGTKHTIKVSDPNQKQKHIEHHYSGSPSQENLLYIQQEVEEEVDEIQYDENGNQIIVKKKIKKKIKVPIYDKSSIDPSKIKRTASGTEYIDEEDVFDPGFNIKKGKAKQKVKVKVQKKNSKGEIYEVEEEVEKDIEGDIIQFGGSDKKFLKTIKTEKVRKVRKNSKGEDEEYFEEIQKEVFFEVDDQGNILKEMDDNESLNLSQSIRQQLSNKKLTSNNLSMFSPDKYASPGKKKVVKKRQVEKKRQNSKGEVETYYEDEFYEEEVSLDGNYQKDSNGNPLIVEKDGQTYRKKIVTERVKKQRQNSKGEMEEYYEDVEKEVLSPVFQSYNSQDSGTHNKKYLNQIEKQINKQRQDIKNKVDKENEIKRQLRMKPVIIPFKSGRRLVEQLKVIKKQRKNSKGELVDFEEEEKIKFELQPGEDIDEQGNIIDKKTGAILKTNDEVTEQALFNIGQKSNIDSNTQEVQAQTDISLLWPLIQNILKELGIDPEKIKDIQNKYFMPNSDPRDINKLMENATKSDEDQYDPDSLKNGKGDKQKKTALQGSNPKGQQPNSKFNNPKNQNEVQVEQQFIDPQKDQLLRLFEQIEYDEEDEFQRDLKMLEDKALLLEPTIKKLYLHIRQAKDKHVLEVRKKIRKYYGKEGDGYITYDEFKNYYLKLMTVHNRCGDSCIHLQRFFAKIGFTCPKFQRRRELRPAKQKPIPFSENEQPKQNDIQAQYKNLFQQGSPFQTGDRYY